MAAKYRKGACIEADSDGGHFVSGRLARDHDDLDGVVSVVDEESGEVLRLNAWLWSIVVVDEE